MQDSKIQWTDHTFNPWIGCTKVHTGCEHCYAEELMDTRYGRVKWGPTGTRSRTKTWGDPVNWNRNAAHLRKRFRVFCASLADVFEDRAELHPWRAELFTLIDNTPWLDWLLLTKRPENILRLWPDDKDRHNCWLGTSVSNQSTFREYGRRLLAARKLVPVLFLSAEPLIGEIDMQHGRDGLKFEELEMIDWVIVGGESGRQARPCLHRWIDRLVRDCRSMDMPCFVKQWGSNPQDDGSRFWKKPHAHIAGHSVAECGWTEPSDVVSVSLKSPKGDDPSEWDASWGRQLEDLHR